MRSWPPRSGRRPRRDGRRRRPFRVRRRTAGHADHAWERKADLVIGVGGLIEPRALGVGYDVIEAPLNGQLVGRALLALMIVKATIWVISLGSGTSGGVLAPLLIMGASLGGLEASSSRGGPRLLAARQHGRDPRRNDAFAAHRHRVRARAHARLGDGVPAARRRADGVRVHGARLRRSILTEKVSPARLPPQPRVRDRAARDPLRSRGHEHQVSSSPRRSHVPSCSLRSTETRAPALLRRRPRRKARRRHHAVDSSKPGCSATERLGL